MSPGTPPTCISEAAARTMQKRQQDRRLQKVRDHNRPKAAENAVGEDHRARDEDGCR